MSLSPWACTHRLGKSRVRVKTLRSEIRVTKAGFRASLLGAEEQLERMTMKTLDTIELFFESQEGENRKMAVRLEAALQESQAEDVALSAAEARLERLQSELGG